MINHDESIEARRKFLKLVGGGAVLVPLAGLSACSGGDEPASAGGSASESASQARSEPASEPATGMAEDQAAGEPATEESDDMPRLSEDDPQAKSLGYVHDATTVDQSKYPRYESGQLCSNCALYQGGPDSEWGGCSIFPGRLVNASGWCTAYAPTSG